MTTEFQQDTKDAWGVHWAPGGGEAGLPPVEVLHDPGDERSVMAVALAAHHPGRGQITVHPTPVSTVRATLAHDVLRALGKSPLANAPQYDFWASGSVLPWRAVAAWISVLGITRLVICRAQGISPSQWTGLLALRALLGIRLALVIHGRAPAPLKRLLDSIDLCSIDSADALAPPNCASPGKPIPWRHAGTVYPASPNAPWCDLPPPPRRPAPDSIRPYKPVVARKKQTADSVRQDSVAADRIHAHIAHPVYAAIVAVRFLTGCTTHQATLIRLPEAELTAWAPAWAQPLVAAASRYQQLTAAPGQSSVFSLMPREYEAVEEALLGCRLRPT
ncbi:hypothetical protein [Streptomyces anulatus]|uniref:hypothetical protein n=1 Tax=Streptomyces anulatus TaxID=1892 RepID=UPI0036C354B9